MNTEVLFLKNNLEAYFIRIIQIIFGFSYIIIGLFLYQHINWYFIVIGILFFLLSIVIGSKKYSFLKLDNSNLLYKKSFFHKVISINCKSINNIDVSDSYLVINTGDKKYKIYTANIREYEVKNAFPDFISKLKSIVNCNFNNLAT